MSSSPHKISGTSFGPHDHLDLAARPGKITVLTGPNGAGKTQVLDAVDAAQRGSGRITTRDGAVSGSFSFGGVTINVARGGANRRSGELVVTSLEDRLSIGEFVDPRYKSADAADEARIRALLLLAGVEASIEKFYEIAESRELFDAIVDEDAKTETDIIKMATRVKRCFEAEARKVEDSLKEVERERDAARTSIEGIDFDQPHDRDALVAGYKDAVAKQTQVLEMRSEADRQKVDREKASAQLESAKAEYDGYTSEQAEKNLAAAQAEQQKAAESVADLEKALNAARIELKRSDAAVKANRGFLDAARHYERMTAAWEATLNEPLAEGPSQEEIEAAIKAVAAAQDAMDNGVLIRDAMDRRDRVDNLTETVIEKSQRAETLRSAARNTQVVLSKLVGETGVPLRVNEEFRLLAKHEKRGECYFAELSMGEKWATGIQIVLDRAGEDGGLLVIPQESWESLDFDHRQAIAKHIEGSSIAILAAEASQEPGATGVEAREYETA